MEPRVSYALVGLFVLVLSSAFIIMALWLIGVGPAGDYRTFAIYPPESVAGIAGESLVKYQGVDVGKVREVGIDPEDPRRIRVLINVRQDVPIKVDTTASIASQGLTGLLYFIQLHGGEPGSPSLEPEPGQDYPVIRAVHSDLSQIQRTGTELLEEAKGAAAELRDTLAMVRSLVEDDERAAIRTGIHDTSRAAAHLSQAAGTLEDHLEQLGPMLHDLSSAVARLPGLADRAGETLDTAGAAAIAIGQAARRLDDLTAQAAPGLTTLTRDGMPELVALLRDLRGLTGRLDRLAADLEQDPNLLIYGRTRRPGPGER
jgi:phospholipid/cholesterol/gamma-HCH transport system substrate-binding protein